jgi:hypothetical protein
MGEPSDTCGDPDRRASPGGGARSGMDATTRIRGEELSDTEIAPDDDLEREGVRVLDEASDLDEDKEEANTGFYSSSHNFEEVSPGTSSLEIQLSVKKSYCGKDYEKKTDANGKKLPQPPTSQLDETIVGSRNVKSCFPLQYFTIRATKQRSFAPAVLGGGGGGSGSGCTECGSMHSGLRV